MRFRAVAFLFAFLPSFLFSQESISNEIIEKIFGNVVNDFPYTWKDKTVFSSVFEVGSKENVEAAIFFETELSHLAGLTGVDLENAASPLYISNRSIVRERFLKSDILLMIGNDVVRGGEFDSKVNNILDRSRLDIAFESSEVVKISKMGCGVAIKKGSDGYDKAVVFINEGSSYKKECIRKLVPYLLNLDGESIFFEKNDYLKYFVLSAVGFCRGIEEYNFSCIKKRLNSSIAMVGDIWAELQ